MPNTRSRTPRIALIAAVARNRVIGSGNAMPWHLSEDLKRFKALTTGHTVIMGRKTFESIGRPLPKRRNIVITRSADFTAAGAETAHSIADALARCAGEDEVFVVGGGEIYRQALPLAHRLHVTEIDADYEGDTTFPDFPPSQWRESSREQHTTEGGLAFDFVIYDKT